MMYFGRSWLAPVALALLLPSAGAYGSDTTSKALDARDAKDYARARQLFAQACKAGDSASCTLLGVMLERGEGGPPDMARARILYRHACTRGYAHGCEAEKKLKEFEDMRIDNDQLCRDGDAESCLQLGRMFERGIGGAQDKVGAREAYGRACKEGMATGCFMLGVMFDNGEGGPQDATRARALYEQACKGGDKRGCVNR
jgi:TPR repeat protein